MALYKSAMEARNTSRVRTATQINLEMKMSNQMDKGKCECCNKPRQSYVTRYCPTCHKLKLLEEITDTENRKTPLRDQSERGLTLQ